MDCRSLDHMLRVLEHKGLDRAVVDLPEVHAVRRVQVKHARPAEDAVGRSQAASHLAVFAGQQLGRHFLGFLSGQLGLLDLPEDLLDVCIVDFLVELDCEDGLLGIHQEVDDLCPRFLVFFYYFSFFYHCSYYFYQWQW